jgi:hypothetical protein
MDRLWDVLKGPQDYLNVTWYSILGISLVRLLQSHRTLIERKEGSSFRGQARVRRSERCPRE